MLVRDARDDDMGAVQAIYAHHVLHGTASFEEEPPPLAEMQRRRGEVLARGLPYLVAEIDGRVVGYSYATPYRARSAYRFSIENSVYVDHARQRLGVGRALLTELIARCERGKPERTAKRAERHDPMAAMAIDQSSDGWRHEPCGEETDRKSGHRKGEGKSAFRCDQRQHQHRRIEDRAPRQDLRDAEHRNRAPGAEEEFA